MNKYKAPLPPNTLSNQDGTPYSASHEVIAEGVSNEYLHGEMHQLRREIDACIQTARARQEQMFHRPGSRELALSITKLQEAKMWCGKVLEELGSPLPEKYRDEAK